MGHHHHISGKNLGITVGLNILITLGQIIGGIWSGSLALLSDAAHNFSDVLALIISYVANRLSTGRKQNIYQTYGFKRAEIIAAFINASTLFIVAFYLIVESVKRFIRPEEIQAGTVIWLALLSILANGISVLLLKNDAKNNLNIKSAYIHLFTDMLTSVAVLLGGLLMKFKGWYGVDAVISILIALYLIIIAYKLWSEAFEILMQFAPSDIKINEINLALKKLDGVKNVHHVHIWRLNEHEIHFEAHLAMDKDIPISEFDRICEQAEKILREKFGITHTNLQPEFKRKESHFYIIQDD